MLLCIFCRSLRLLSSSGSVTHDFLKPCCQACNALQLGRDDDLGRTSVGHLCHRLQTLQSKHCLIRTRFTDHADTFGVGLLYFQHSLCLTFCLADHLLLLCLCTEDSCLLLGLGIAVSSVVGAFERVVAQLTLIMAFQSLILDMAGNVGTQSLAVTIRVLMDENLTLRQKMRLVGKEVRVGLFDGLILGMISAVCVGVYIALVKGRGIGFSFAVSGCIGVSMLVAMVFSSAVGTLVPLFFKRVGVDPAVASGPLITTINDLVAVITYYGLAWAILINLLHLES